MNALELSSKFYEKWRDKNIGWTKNPKLVLEAARILKRNDVDDFKGLRMWLEDVIVSYTNGEPMPLRRYYR